MPGGMPSVPPELATALILSSLDSRSISRLVCLRKKSKSLYRRACPGTYLAGMVLFPIRFGVVSYTIRILMYPDVSGVYPVEYMYPGCILKYIKCILNALLHSKRIHVS